MLSDALFPEPDAPPHEQTIDNTEKTIHAEIIAGIDSSEVTAPSCRGE